MEKAQRVELIKARFRAKVGKGAYVSSGRAPREPQQPARESRVTLGSFGLALAHRWGRTRWLEASDAAPAFPLGERHRAGVPALTKIAAQAPRKLVRRRTADELVAGRAPPPPPSPPSPAR